jgi:hypothetical protein
MANGNMKYGIGPVIFTLFLTQAFAQNLDTNYKVDTVRVNGDSAFVTAKLFGSNNTVTAFWEMVNLPYSCTFNGIYHTFYNNGNKKSKGTYTWGTKNSDWIYWDSNGKEITELEQKTLNQK